VVQPCRISRKSPKHHFNSYAALIHSWRWQKKQFYKFRKNPCYSFVCGAYAPTFTVGWVSYCHLATWDQGDKLWSRHCLVWHFWCNDAIHSLWPLHGVSDDRCGPSTLVPCCATRRYNHNV
jgi:hypothetical protein